MNTRIEEMRPLLLAFIVSALVMLAFLTLAGMNGNS